MLIKGRQFLSPPLSFWPTWRPPPLPPPGPNANECFVVFQICLQEVQVSKQQAHFNVRPVDLCRYMAWTVTGILFAVLLWICLSYIWKIGKIIRLEYVLQSLYSWLNSVSLMGGKTLQFDLTPHHVASGCTGSTIQTVGFFSAIRREKILSQREQFPTKMLSAHKEK